MPFMFVRLVYSILVSFGIFGKNSGFEGVAKKLVDAFVLGRPGVWLGMGVLMEWAVVLICLGAGVWTAGEDDKHEGPRDGDGGVMRQSQGYAPHS
jgi:hypothetical protein